MKTKKNQQRHILRMRTMVLLSLPVMFCLSCRMESGESRASSDSSKIVKTFTGIHSVDISTVSGNCIIVKGDSAKVTVLLSQHYRPANTFEPVMKKYDDMLQLKEKMSGSNSGYSEWMVKVPEKMNVTFNSASGGISVDGITGKINIHTASGSIDATGITLTANSEFTTASGNVTIKFANSPSADVLASSASGNVLVNYNNNQVSGKVEMKARIEKGRIICPFAFTTENKVYSGGQEYMVKSFTSGQSTPVIKIYTASGTARLKK